MKIAATPRAFKSATIIIGEDEFQAHVSSAEFDNGAGSDTSWTGLDGTTHTDTSAGKPTVKLAVVQDWGNPESLVNYLYDNAGLVKPCSLEYDDGPKFACTVTLVKPLVGGKVNEFNESTVSLPSSDITKTPATP